MSGKTIGIGLNYGYAGNVSRTPDCIVEAKPTPLTNANILFGQPVQLNPDNTVKNPSSTLTPTNFLGLAVSEVKQFMSYSPTQNSTQQGFYAPGDTIDVVKRGDVTVKVAHGTPTAGGAVYARIALNVAFPNEVIGDLRADADGANTIVLPNTSWKTGYVDANNVAEITLKTMNN